MDAEAALKLNAPQNTDVYIASGMIWRQTRLFDFRECIMDKFTDWFMDGPTAPLTVAHQN